MKAISNVAGFHVPIAVFPEKGVDPARDHSIVFRRGVSVEERMLPPVMGIEIEANIIGTVNL